MYYVYMAIGYLIQKISWISNTLQSVGSPASCRALQLWVACPRGGRESTEWGSQKIYNYK